MDVLALRRNSDFTGGASGAWVAQALLKQFNAFGSSIFTLLIFCVALALSISVSVAKFGGSNSCLEWFLGLARDETRGDLCGLCGRTSRDESRAFCGGT